jgi:UDP-N-acetylmuramoylalanine--D-glutamate ligase
VVELSSFQLAGIHGFRPRAAAFLNLAPDHLDRHGGLDAYAAAKRRIFENQEPGDVAVVNADDPVTRDTAVRSRKRLFSRRGPVADGCFVVRDGEGERVIEVAPGGGEAGDAELFRAADSPLPGAHNLENAMAAALLARALGAAPADCRRALAAFRGLPHRMERVAEAGGVAWYDDSKGTNPAATLGCLQGFADGTVHLILGGRNKGADFRDLAPAVARKARRVYLVGEAAGELEAALAGAGSVPLSRSGTLERAVAEAAERAAPGEAVLLSPACASFDQFRDFNERGDVFQRLVRAAVGGAVGQEAGV